MSVQAAMLDYLRHRMALWERRRTEKFISNLPAEIQKDIGWPAAESRRRIPRQVRDSFWERRW
ncbi:hypothetical protein [Chelativorans sp. M5D2P16]|nr:hypothetical protein [Chelativorans sp. M5D2P16]MDZ5698215.1 hypothetical protein [Chelativorans sp. M5D2P16]